MAKSSTDELTLGVLIENGRKAVEKYISDRSKKFTHLLAVDNCQTQDKIKLEKLTKSEPNID